MEKIVKKLIKTIQDEKRKREQLQLNKQKQKQQSDKQIMKLNQKILSIIQSHQQQIYDTQMHYQIRLQQIQQQKDNQIQDLQQQIQEGLFFKTIQRIQHSQTNKQTYCRHLQKLFEIYEQNRQLSKNIQQMLLYQYDLQQQLQDMKSIEESDALRILSQATKMFRNKQEGYKLKLVIQNQVFDNKIKNQASQSEKLIRKQKTNQLQKVQKQLVQQVKKRKQMNQILQLSNKKSIDIINLDKKIQSMEQNHKEQKKALEDQVYSLYEEIQCLKANQQKIMQQMVRKILQSSINPSQNKLRTQNSLSQLRQKRKLLVNSTQNIVKQNNILGKQADFQCQPFEISFISEIDKNEEKIKKNSNCQQDYTIWNFKQKSAEQQRQLI